MGGAQDRLRSMWWVPTVHACTSVHLIQCVSNLTPLPLGAQSCMAAEARHVEVLSGGQRHVSLHTQCFGPAGVQGAFLSAAGARVRRAHPHSFCRVVKGEHFGGRKITDCMPSHRTITCLAHGQ